MATFRVLEPEVAGDFGGATVLDHSTRPPEVLALEYQFEQWLGDELLTTHPCYIVTARLREALEQLAGTGYSFHDLKVSKSEAFDQLYANRELPQFFWMKIHGVPGVDDMGLRSKDQSLVVSDRVLELLRHFRIDHCLIRKKPFRSQ
jgi:hypothetical protein